MTNKQIFNITVAEVKNLIDAEIARVEGMSRRDSNRAKLLTKNRFMLYLLDSVPDELILTVEGVSGNEHIREFYLVNYGSVVECLVKYHLTTEKQHSYCKTWCGVDVKWGCLNCEVKSSLCSNALARPSEAEMTLLVNHEGVFLIKKAEVLSYCNKQNRLPYNRECGHRIEWLSEAMGL